MKYTLLLMALVGLSCKSIGTKKHSKSITVRDFGLTEDGRQSQLYTLTNQKGMSVSISDFGGVIIGINVPDRNGIFEDVVLGMDSIDLYQGTVPNFGALIGRFANRINQGKFVLDGKEFNIGPRPGSTVLHGGEIGFDRVYWSVQAVSGASPSLVLNYLSKDGEEGFPGNLQVQVVYTLTKDNALKIDYEASTDKPTVVNLTNHAYFNLSGMKEDVKNHILQLDASAYLPTNRGIPTGVYQEVLGSPFDFLEAKRIGQDIDSLRFGYDHNYILDDLSAGLKRAGSVYHQGSGRFMEVHTTEPGVQLYTANWLNGSLVGKDNITYKKNYGICLETQHFPDSPNQPKFPSTRLDPSETFRSTTVYSFGVR